MTCPICDGSGILIGSLFHYDNMQSFDADQIARCDTCQQYSGDLEAAEALAASQLYGAWVVWAGGLNGGLPATPESNIYVRTTPGDAACLQLALLRDSQSEPGVPDVLAHVKFIEQAA